MYTVLIFYEFLITFGAEVDLFWRKEVTGASILFLLNRYLVLSYNLVQLPSWWTSNSVSPSSV